MTAPAAPDGAARSFRYFSFLSYSHRDHRFADWLHDSLEKYRVPKGLVGKVTSNGPVPARLNPIFRDRHELAASDDLASTIREALGESRFLIVLCSPASAASRWTAAEIDGFKKLRPDGCVVAAIIEGEPFASEMPGREREECFPPALRHKYDRRGRPTKQRAEPIAADFRDGGDGRRLGLLKIVAGLLGVGLDELVQRESHRRHKRLRLLMAASLAGMAVTSTLAIVAVHARNEARDQRREAEGLVGFMLGDLRAKLEPLGGLDALDSVGSKALAYYERQDKSSLSDDSLAQRARALTMLGEIANNRGDLDGALARYREALASTAEQLRRAPRDPQRLFDHAQNVYWVGYIDWQRGRIGEAADAFRHYRQLAAQMIAADPANGKWQLEAVYADGNLGAVMLDQHRFREAANAYRRSLGPIERLAAAEPANRDYQVQRIETLAWLADAEERSGRLDSAIALRERQARLLEGMMRANGNDTLLQRQALTAQRALGRLRGARGDVAGGLVNAKAAIRIADALYAREPANTEWLQANAWARFDLADLLLADDELDQAARSIGSACDIVARLNQRNAGVADWKSGLGATCLNARGRFALRQGNARSAETLAGRELAVARSSTKPIERAFAIREALSLSGTAAAELGRPAEARVRWQAAKAAVPPAIELRPREMAEQVILDLRLRNPADAAPIAARLRSIGFRHPAYLRDLALLQ